ncbi:hypothetical protein ElyMa_006003700 [Elysia marginata]|uniref:Uncharacterized protein n=1 Tax=Elysia marginata TaxID=1093978 RepID=A0AAV4GGA8_9GAST|nr:hypothetical protein ElyMa_006003700 [Elysia marginata]
MMQTFTYVVAAILVCALAVPTIAEKVNEREKRSEVSLGLLNALKGLPKDNVINARSLTKNTRSLSNCNPSGGQTGSQGSSNNIWDFGPDSYPVYKEGIVPSSAISRGYSSWTTYCYHALAVFQLIFVLMSRA